MPEKPLDGALLVSPVAGVEMRGQHERPPGGARADPGHQRVQPRGPVRVDGRGLARLAQDASAELRGLAPGERLEPEPRQ